MSRVSSPRRTRSPATGRSVSPHPPSVRPSSRWRSSRRCAGGEFDQLPGAGKPLEGLGESHDPDWWIRRKIEREQLRGLGPPALMLRVEHAELEERLDALTREDEVREYIEDFNRRIVEARRQLLGGPPVVTPTRDADAEVRAWHERRAARSRADAEASAADAETSRRRRLLRWRRRD